jgi:hypothetical protein
MCLLGLPNANVYCVTPLEIDALRSEESLGDQLEVASHMGI